MAGPPSLSVLLRRFSNLEEAWRHVHSHAIRSQSSEIRAEARLFEQSVTVTLRSVQSRLGQDRFKFEPARGITIRRKGKTPRPVVVAPIESRIVQRALLNVLQGIPAIKSALQAGYNYGGVSGSRFGVPAARSGPRNLDSGLSEIFIVFQAAVPEAGCVEVHHIGVRRPSAL